MRPKFPIGHSDFCEIRENGYFYIDKTAFVQDVLDANVKILLLPRPRRFGKTLNLSMLRAFLAKNEKDLSPLFQELAIWQAGPAYREHFQRYPTIFFSFKDVKARSVTDCMRALVRLVAAEFDRHGKAVLAPGLLTQRERAYFDRIVMEKADPAELWGALRELSDYLFRAYGEKIVILIDEYDTPIHGAFANGYHDDVVEFFRNFLSGGLKDNPHLFKGVLTGILRVAKESIFSGLNNIAVYSLLRSECGTRFGFTDPEVVRMIEAVGQPELIDGIRRWYNGYLFGGQVIYNPWSVLNCLDSADKEFRPYWVSTSSDDILRGLLLSADGAVREAMEDLLHGGSIEKPIEENIVLRDVAQRPEALWSFLLFSGYLKITSQRKTDDVLLGTLTVPNLEVASTYRSLFRSWLEEGLGGAGPVLELVAALLAGDDKLCEELLDTLLLHAFSVHDTPATMNGPRSRKEPERVYQAFILGLLVILEPRYEVRSNRESGRGRYDVMILPKTPGQAGVVLELKVLDKRRSETPDKALNSALAQLLCRDYAAELRARGASPIQQLAIVFQGKRAWVRAAGPSQA